MFEFKLPDLGEGVAEGEILTWHVAPGDVVAEDDVLAEVETDKAAVDVPSPVDGTVRELRFEEGDVVEVGEVVVAIEDGDRRTSDDERSEETATAESEQTGEAAASAEGGRVFAPPNVRRLAREMGVDVTAVAGSGPSGRVTQDDVRAAAEREGGDGRSGPERTGSDSGAASEGTEDGSQLKSAVSRVSDDGGGGDGEEEAPRSAIRRIAEDEPAESVEPDEPAVKSAAKRVGAGDGDATRDQTLATPATRQVARELGVDVDAVPTDESRDGEAYVSEAAVRSYAETEGERGEPPGPVSGEAATGETGDGEATDTTATDASGAEKPVRREPYRGIRRTIGERMARSRQEVPHATHHDLADAGALVDVRERLVPRAEDRGVRLTYMPFVLKAVSAALREHPALNAELDEEAEEIRYKEYYDVGVATATDAGLMVPVVEAVDEKGLLELATEINDLAERARDRSIERSEMEGGTFTVTNFGAIGGEFANPVINAPQTAILGIGALKERAVAEEGNAVARQTLPLSLAVDHRVVDGADAARFVNTVKEYLADPTLLLLE